VKYHLALAESAAPGTRPVGERGLTIVGRAQPVAMDLALHATREILHLQGSFTIKQTDFGIRPYSAALGTVKVKNEITFVLDIRARANR
jgi:polyisoprenoid-binding protein YceI